jgi:hypothetical protein
MRIEKIVFSRHIATKLYFKHGLTTTAVEELAVLAANDEVHWSVTEEHGGRVIIETTTFDNEPFYISLSPIDVEKGVWQCVTAFVPTNESYR